MPVSVPAARFAPAVAGACCGGAGACASDGRPHARNAHRNASAMMFGFLSIGPILSGSTAWFSLPCLTQSNPSSPAAQLQADQGSAVYALGLLFADPAPGGIQKIPHSPTHHLNPPDRAIFDLERLGAHQARWPIEIFHRYILA